MAKAITGVKIVHTGMLTRPGSSVQANHICEFVYSKENGPTSSDFDWTHAVYDGPFIFYNDSFPRVLENWSFMSHFRGTYLSERIQSMIRLIGHCRKGWHNPDSGLYGTAGQSKFIPANLPYCPNCRFVLEGVPIEWPWFTEEELAGIPAEAIITEQ